MTAIRGAADPEATDAAPGNPTSSRRIGTAVGTLVVIVAAIAIRRELVFGLLVVAAIFVPMERVFALRPQRVFRTAWKTDLVHLLVNNVLTTAGVIAAVVAVGLGLRRLVPSAVSDTIHAWPLAVQFLVAFAVTEVCVYWAHRATHQVPFLWQFHKVHHSIAELDWLAAARLHPIDQAFTRSCAVLPLFALGFSRSTFGAYLAFVPLQALFVHANVRFTFGPLRYLVATPAYHHWHHADVTEISNVNFGGQLPVIDAIFGTLHLPKDRWPAAYGIDEPIPPGYLRQLAWPLRDRVPSAP